VEALLEALVARWTRAPRKRLRASDRTLLQEVRREFRLQLHAEERVLYSRLLDRTPHDPAVLDGLDQHRELERWLDEIDVAEPPSEQALRKLRNLKWSAEMHFEHEEDRVFDTARDVIDERTAERLGLDWLRSDAA